MFLRDCAIALPSFEFESVSGGGSPSPSPAAATPAAPAAPSATPQAPSAAPAAPATPTAAPQTPATGAPDGWVPSYRVRETREAAIREAQAQFAQRENAYRQQLEQTRAQLQALTGVTPQNQNPEVDAVRQQFGQLYPGLSKLEQNAAQVEALLARMGDFESQQEHYWQTYGRQTMDRLFNLASEGVGIPLNDEAKRILHSSFVGFVQSSPELAQRYSSDPTIVEDFWKAYQASFIDPVRRTQAASIAGRANGLPAMPQDTPGGIPASAPGPKPSSMDDRVALAWSTYNSTAR